MQITRGVIQTAQKVVVYGPEGIGKSTFASKFPEPLFIDTEGSTKLLDVNRTPKPSSWTMLLEQVRYVRKNPHICKTLIVDTADWAEMLCINHVCAKSGKSGIEDFGWGHGYTYLAEEFGTLLNLLEEVVEQGVHVVITAHATMRKFEQPDEMGAYDRWELKLQKKTAPLIKEWADMVLFANFKTFVINVDNQGAQKGKNKAQGGRRVMYATHHPCWDAKNRHGLPDESEFAYEIIAPHIQGAAPKNEPVAATTPTPPAAPPPTEEPPKPDPIPEPTKETVPPPAPPKETVPPPEPATEPPKEEASPPLAEPEKPKGVPEQRPMLPHLKPLYDLMDPPWVSIAEVQEVVAQKGYYPIDTPIENYDKAFVSGVLIGAWPQVLKAIEENRPDIPF